MKDKKELKKYNNPIPVVVCLLPIKNKDNSIGLIGIIRNIEPKIGEIALPGGFIDEGEDVFMAAKRELQEETGLIDNLDLLIYDSQITPNNMLLIFVLNDNVLEYKKLNELKLNKEVKGFQIINKETKIAFPLHKMLVDKFFDMKNNKVKKYGFNN